MIILFNVIFRILHALMVFFPARSVIAVRLRQLAEDALLMKRVAADIRLAGEVFRQMSRGTGGHIPGAEQFVEYTLFYAAHSLGWGLFYGLSSRWPEWLIHELEFRGADIEEAYWCEGRSSGFRDAYDSRTFPEDVSMVVADR